MRLTICFVLLSLLPVNAGNLTDIVTKGKVLLNIRYRLEWVDQENFEKDALASTMRTRLGYQFAEWRGWQALVEFENTASLGNENHYDTKNNRFDRPVVADPEDTEANRFQLVYKGLADHEFTLGRQRLDIDNARFVGNVGWRQNEQTFDALTWNYKGVKKSVLTVNYLANANRVFGGNHPNSALSDTVMDSYLVNFKTSSLPVGNLTIFGYLFDLKNAREDSHENFGFRLDGKTKIGEALWITHDLSFADQSSFQDGRDVIDARYYSAGAGPSWTRFSINLNYEVLGGNGSHGFTTPLATLHAFNGWADVFLSTPTTGLVDLFLKAGYQSGGWNIVLAGHTFESDEGNTDYGDELDFLLEKKIGRYFLTGLKFADYRAERFGQDTRKAWLYLQAAW